MVELGIRPAVRSIVLVTVLTVAAGAVAFAAMLSRAVCGFSRAVAVRVNFGEVLVIVLWPCVSDFLDSQGVHAGNSLS